MTTVERPAATDRSETPATRGVIGASPLRKEDDRLLRGDGRFTDDVDLTRASSSHLAFGYGIHFCIGAPLARLESKIALGIMLERLPEMRRVQGVPLEPTGSFILNGVRHLPIMFQRS